MDNQFRNAQEIISKKKKKKAHVHTQTCMCYWEKPHSEQPQTRKDPSREVFYAYHRRSCREEEENAVYRVTAWASNNHTDRRNSNTKGTHTVIPST